MHVPGITIRALGAIAFAAAVMAACGGPTESEGHEEPDVTGFELIQGQNTVTLGPGGQSGLMTVVMGQPNDVSVRVLGATDGDEPEVVEHPDEFELRMVTPSGITRFTATGAGYPYRGTIDPGTVAGQAIYFVELHGIDHGHGAEFRAPLTVTVVPAP